MIVQAGTYGGWGWDGTVIDRWLAELLASDQSKVSTGPGQPQFDGVVDHKLLRLHQVRPGVANLLAYDAVWIGLSVLFLAVGVALVRGDAHAERRADLSA